MADKKTGRPPMYATPEEMQKKIDAYFDGCAGIPWIDDDGKVVMTPKGDIVYKRQPKPYTITGLALALGFTSRHALINYQHKDAFVDTVTRAKSIVEEYVETRLFDKDGANGAKFSLANNFRGWREKQDLDINGGIKIDLGDAGKYSK